MKMTAITKKRLSVVISEETDTLLKSYIGPAFIEHGWKNLISPTVERAIIEYIERKPFNKYILPYHQLIPDFLNKEELV